MMLKILNLKIISFETDSENMKIHLKYDVSRHFISNIDLVIHFDDTVPVS